MSLPRVRSLIDKYHFFTAVWFFLFLFAFCTFSASGAKPSPKETPSARLAQDMDGDFVWQAIAQEKVQSVQPPEWLATPPSKEALNDWKEQEYYRLIALANRCRDFYTNFPEESHAKTAMEKEWQSLVMATQVKSTPQLVERLDATEQKLLVDGVLTSRERFGIRAAQVQRNFTKREDFEKDVRNLMKEFPDDNRVYKLLFSSIKNAQPAHVRKVAEEILKSAAPYDVKTEVTNFLKTVDIIGKPLEITFKSLNGHQINIQDFNGKVVLVDFWATWCHPCVTDLPLKKEIYEKFNEQGFEIVGISFDRDRYKLIEFIKVNKVPWLIYCDGKMWDGLFAFKYGIDSIPRLWLVDKKGILRDMDAQKNLMTKIENLLAEP